MNKNVLEEKINNQVDMIVERDILTCETMLFDEINKIAYEVETDLSQLLYENFENLFPDNADEIEELEDKIQELDNTDEIEELEDKIRELESEQDEPQEIFEIWKISSWLYEKLREQGEPVLKSDFGYYWGRTCSGQSMKLDYCIKQIAKKMIESYGL